MGWFYDTFVKDEVEAHFQPKGDYQAKGEYATQKEIQANYAQKKDVVTTLKKYTSSKDLQNTLKDYTKNNDLSKYAIQADVDRKLNDYVPVNSLQDTVNRLTLSNYATPAQVDAKINGLNINQYAPKTELDNYLRKRADDPDGNYLSYGDFTNPIPPLNKLVQILRNDQNPVNNVLNARYQPLGQGNPPRSANSPELTITTDKPSIVADGMDDTILNYIARNVESLTYRVGDDPPTAVMIENGQAEGVLQIGPVSSVPTGEKINVVFEFGNSVISGAQRTISINVEPKAEGFHYRRRAYPSSHY